MKDLTTKKEEEILKDLLEKKKAMHELRFQVAGGKAQSAAEGRNLRKDVARIETELQRRKKNT